jgi:4-alpha-glucanotransferase
MRPHACYPRTLGPRDTERPPDARRRARATAYTVLAAAPSAVVTATLEDAAGVEPRPNMPGTVREWPNWSEPLPVDLDTLARSRQTLAIARVLTTRGRRIPPPTRFRKK